ncbi:MAG: choice-of-anchor Q domain-containing protein, partial [Pyrinomonadaceae bacterium]
MFKNKMSFLLTTIFFSAVFFAVQIFGQTFAPTATITVHSNADAGGTCPGATCTLRQAIATAAAGDTIDFDMTMVTSPITLASEIAVNKHLTIYGPGANVLTISGNNAVRVFNITSGNVTLSGLTIANGNAPDGTGLTGGGGILNSSIGTVTISNCTISGNKATFGYGGGVQNNSTTGTLNITGSTINSNSATYDSNTGNGGSGGGIFNNSGVLNVTNSTIYGNVAPNSGGGIYNGFSGTLNVTNCTLNGNNAGQGGGIINNNTANVKNSIIAGNIGNVGQDADGAFNSQGYNLIGISDPNYTIGFTNGINNDQVGSPAAPIDPRLGPLQYNGGTTQTMALLAGSPAIDKGSAANNPATGQPIITDQRGFTRPVDNPSIPNAPGGDGSDIGAFEVQRGGTPTYLAFSVQPSNTPPGQTIMPAVQVQILDAAGNLTNSNANVTIAIGNNPSGGTLSGTTTVAAAGGTATFSNLSINQPGNGYTLIASSVGLTSATSNPFNIAPLPDLTITKTHMGNFQQGQRNAQYTITVSNINPTATSGTV